MLSLANKSIAQSSRFPIAPCEQYHKLLWTRLSLARLRLSINALAYTLSAVLQTLHDRVFTASAFPSRKANFFEDEIGRPCAESRSIWPRKAVRVLEILHI